MQVFFFFFDNQTQFIHVNKDRWTVHGMQVATIVRCQPYPNDQYVYMLSNDSRGNVLSVPIFMEVPC